MPNYNDAKVYKIINDLDEKIYVGSTTQSLAKRLGNHKVKARRNPERTVYAHLNVIGWERVRIILIENVNCQDAEQLRMREQHYIDLLRPELNRIPAHVDCPHGRRHRQCVECNGSGICEHQRRRNRCVDCGGASICSHGRHRFACQDCNGDTYHCECCEKTYTSRGNLNRHNNTIKHIVNFIQF